MYLVLQLYSYRISGQPQRRIFVNRHSHQKSNGGSPNPLSSYRNQERILKSLLYIAEIACFKSCRQSDHNRKCTFWPLLFPKLHIPLIPGIPFVSVCCDFLCGRFPNCHDIVFKIKNRFFGHKRPHFTPICCFFNSFHPVDRCQKLRCAFLLERCGRGFIKFFIYL